MTSMALSSPCPAGSEHRQWLDFMKCSLPVGKDRGAGGAGHSESKAVSRRGPRSNPVESNLFPGQMGEAGLGGSVAPAGLEQLIKKPAGGGAGGWSPVSWSWDAQGSFL